MNSLSCKQAPPQQVTVSSPVRQTQVTVAGIGKGSGNDGKSVRVSVGVDA